MNKIPRPDIADASSFENIPEDCVTEFLTYALNSTRLIHDSINRCDTKALAQVPVLVAFYGGYYLWIKGLVSSSALLLTIFYLNTALAGLSIMLCMLCLWVRNLPLPPSIPVVLQWLKQKESITVRRSLFATLFFNLAEAEYENFKIVKNKSFILRLAQLSLILFLFFVLLSAIISIY